MNNANTEIRRFRSMNNEHLSIAASVPLSDKSKYAAAAFAILAGTLGLHKFYIGKHDAGVAMLLIFLFGWVLLGIPSFLVAIVALVEGVIYLTISHEDFARRYVHGDKKWL